MDKKKRPPEYQDLLLEQQRRRSHTDVLGSWTGIPWDPNEEPVQDVDDL